MKTMSTLTEPELCKTGHVGERSWKFLWAPVPKIVGICYLESKSCYKKMILSLWSICVISQEGLFLE